MSIADKIPLNFELLKNPWNWLVLTLMVVIALAALSLLFPHSAPANGSPQ